MGTKTVADTIKQITRKHLCHNNGILLGQAITAVGWVNDTVPHCKNIIELPMADVAGAGIAVGAALVGRRPIFVIRFQDFLILNGSPLIFFAAKVKELHNQSAPIFIRAIGSDGLGPTHSGILHSIYMHFPGFRVCSPMTPDEYKKIWNIFNVNDTPMLVSEHRKSFLNTKEIKDVIVKKPDITIYGISSTRFEIPKAIKLLKIDGINCNFINILWLKPFITSNRLITPLNESKLGIVVDPGHEIAGASQSIAYELNQATGYQVKALGLYDKTKCLCPPLQNKTPDARRIYEIVREIL